MDKRQQGSRAGRWVGTGTHIVQHDADKHVERDPEEVDDCRSALFWHILAAHLHHAGPEEAHTRFKHTEGQQLNLALKGDACKRGRQRKHCLGMKDIALST